jgi:uncharacterized membrane protein YhaH (DUF805 family)
MHALGFLFSPAGRIEPRPFIAGAIGVYLVGVASQLLTTADVARRAGLWPFVAVQLVVVWIWFCLHGKRLHDAGRSSGLAVGVGLLYLLLAGLLLLAADGFGFLTSSRSFGDADAGGLQWLIALLYVVGMLGGSSHYDLILVTVAILIVLAFLPIVVALAVTVWAAKLKSQPPGAESQ